MVSAHEGGHEENSCFRHNRADTQMNSQIRQWRAWGLHRPKPDWVPAQGRKADTNSYLNLESPFNNGSQRKI